MKEAVAIRLQIPKKGEMKMADIKKSVKQELNEAKKLCVFGIGHYLIGITPEGRKELNGQMVHTQMCGEWCDDWQDGVCTFDPVKDLQAIKMDSKNIS